MARAPIRYVALTRWYELSYWVVLVGEPGEHPRIVEQRARESLGDEYADTGNWMGITPEEYAAELAELTVVSMTEAKRKYAAAMRAHMMWETPA